MPTTGKAQVKGERYLNAPRPRSNYSEYLNLYHILDLQREDEGVTTADLAAGMEGGELDECKSTASMRTKSSTSAWHKRQNAPSLSR